MRYNRQNLTILGPMDNWQLPRVSATQVRNHHFRRRYVWLDRLEVPGYGMLRSSGQRPQRRITLTDATRMIQNATHTIPNFMEVYCTDDNARVLLLTVDLEERRRAGFVVGLLAFHFSAFSPATKRFRICLGFDRRRLEDFDSDDSKGRAL